MYNKLLPIKFIPNQYYLLLANNPRLYTHTNTFTNVKFPKM